MDPLTILSVGALAALLTAFGLTVGWALQVLWDPRPEAGRGLLGASGGFLVVSILLALLADFLA